MDGFRAISGNQLLHFGTAKSTWGSGLAGRAHDEVLDHLREQDTLGHGYRCCSRTAAHDVSTKSAVGCRQAGAYNPVPTHPIPLGYERDLTER